jgi:hypothetical protein
MSLNTIIPPEIVKDRFQQAIFSIAATQKLHHILEIGSSSGDGSTQAWVQGIQENPYKPILHCIELSKPRHQLLTSHYYNNGQINCYWASSVGTESFPKEAEVTRFYNTIPSKLRQWPLETVLSWLQTDLDYIHSNNAPTNGIKQALRTINKNVFDAVLIDGSEFTGVAEFAQIYGSTWILLDDILTYKNWDVFHFLSNDSRYINITTQLSVRNGFSIFRHT